MDVVSVLRQLSEARGLPGYEDEVRACISGFYEPWADAVRTDSLGNLIALKKGTRPAETKARSIMLAAHMDEVGLMVSGFEKGFLRFTHMGGVDPRTILGQEVVVYGQRPLPGIIATHPPHVLPPEERNKVVSYEELFIDVGLPEEELKELVRVGDPIAMRREFIELAEGYVSGKAFDDRAGVASLLVCLEALQNLQHSWDVYVVATVQEEKGLKGATVGAYGIAPDIAIAVDVGFGRQPGVEEKESIVMDGGPAIAKGPNIHPVMHQTLVEVAKRYELKHQLEIIPGASGTDAWAIQVTREGIPSALLSIPLRYMHTSVETVCIRDIERTGRLMALFISQLDESFAEKLGLGEERWMPC
ncbi:MAG: M42 family metallopeptidase [Anaerolineae bacterium]|nr:M42 family metallopeptidase [Anaerolineae bacterium]